MPRPADTLARGDLVKGYEFKKNSHLIVDDEGFESARIESSTTVEIDKFVGAAAIDPIYFDASDYVAPDGDAGPDIYLVLRDAIAATGRITLSRSVIARREHSIAIMPMGKGLVVHTLHEERDLNDGKLRPQLDSSSPTVASTLLGNIEAHAPGE